jgi:hypothetical protein
VNRPRHQLLADAALAEQQHRGVGRRRALHCFEHASQRRALPTISYLRLHRQLRDRGSLRSSDCLSTFGKVTITRSLLSGLSRKSTAPD